MALRALPLFATVFALSAGALLPLTAWAADEDSTPPENPNLGVQPSIQDLLRHEIEQQHKMLEQQQKQLQQQQRQLEKQQRQIEALEKAQKQKTPTKTAAKKPAMPPEIRSPKTTGPTIPLNSNMKSDNAKKRGSMRLPHTNLSFTVAGYIKLDAIHDIGNPGDEDSFDPSSIPVSGNAEDRNGRTRLLARQSRLNVDLRRPDTPWGTFHTFLEGDFFGTGGNQRVSNGVGFRLRHAYAELGDLLAGQTWSTFMDADALPSTLDFEGPGGQSFIRQAQIRWTQPFSDQFSVAFSIENPEGDFFNSAGNRTDSDGESFNSDKYPDTVIRARYIDAGWGHVQSAALLRELTANDDAGFHDNAFGYGLNVAGVINTPFIAAKDNIEFQVNYGDGIGRYILDLAGFGYDAVVRGNRLAPLKAWGGYVAFQHWWLNDLRSTAVYSRTHLYSRSFQPGTTLDNTQYGSLNLIWSPVPQVNVGVEALYGRRKNIDGESASAGRVETSGQFFF